MMCPKEDYKREFINLQNGIDVDSDKSKLTRIKRVIRKMRFNNVI